MFLRPLCSVCVSFIADFYRHTLGGEEFIVPDELSIGSSVKCNTFVSDSSSAASDTNTMASQVAESLTSGYEREYDIETSESHTAGASVEGGAFGISASASYEYSGGKGTELLSFSNLFIMKDGMTCST